MISPAEAGSLILGVAALGTSIANWRRTSAQNRLDRVAQSQKTEADLTDDQRAYIETLIGQIKTDREYIVNLEQKAAQFFAELQAVREAFAKVDGRNWDLIREVDRLKSCDTERLQELEAMRQQNVQLQGELATVKREKEFLEDRVALLEAELRKRGIDLPVPDRRRSDADQDPQPLEKEL